MKEQAALELGLDRRELSDTDEGAAGQAEEVSDDGVDYKKEYKALTNYLVSRSLSPCQP